MEHGAFEDSRSAAHGLMLCHATDGSEPKLH